MPPFSSSSRSYMCASPRTKTLIIAGLFLVSTHVWASYQPLALNAILYSEHMLSGTIIESYSQPCCLPFSLWRLHPSILISSILKPYTVCAATPTTIHISPHFHSYYQRNPRHHGLLPDVARCPNVHNFCSLICLSTRSRLPHAHTCHAELADS